MDQRLVVSRTRLANQFGTRSSGARKVCGFHGLRAAPDGTPSFVTTIFGVVSTVVGSQVFNLCAEPEKTNGSDFACLGSASIEAFDPVTLAPRTNVTLSRSDHGRTKRDHLYFRGSRHYGHGLCGPARQLCDGTTIYQRVVHKADPIGPPVFAIVRDESERYVWSNDAHGGTGCAYDDFVQLADHSIVAQKTSWVGGASTMELVTIFDHRRIAFEATAVEELIPSPDGAIIVFHDPNAKHVKYADVRGRARAGCLGENHRLDIRHAPNLPAEGYRGHLTLFGDALAAIMAAPTKSTPRFRWVVVNERGPTAHPSFDVVSPLFSVEGERRYFGIRDRELFTMRLPLSC